MSSHTIYIDDADTEEIEYTTIELGPYRGQGFSPLTNQASDNDSGPIYDGTLSVAEVEDVSATVTFTGTRVSVYGSLRPPIASDVPLPLTKYSIPAWAPEGIPAMAPYQAPNVTEPQNDVNFFTSAVLPLDTYTLWINVTTASPDAPFYLDYIAVEAPGAVMSSTTSFSTSTTLDSTAPPTSATLDSTLQPTSTTMNSSPSPTSATLHSSPPPTSATFNSTPPPSSTSFMFSSQAATTILPPGSGFLRQSAFPKGAIAGIVVGVLVAIAIALLLALICVRRIRVPSERKLGHESLDQKDPAPVTPSVDPSRGVALALESEEREGVMFVPGRSSMVSALSSQSESTLRPASPPGVGSSYHKSRVDSRGSLPQSPPDPDNRISSTDTTASNPTTTLAGSFGYDRLVKYGRINALSRPESSMHCSPEPFPSRLSSGSVDATIPSEARVGATGEGNFGAASSGRHALIAAEERFVPRPVGLGGQDNVELEDELPPPMYSASPRPGENYSVENLRLSPRALPTLPEGVEGSGSSILPSSKGDFVR